ncbi:unnamed protein product [Mytilus edulis]|uniref:Uncharacterized protein n=1 Tax=Mytilus edulis TaxID=6550 RepID=A0A8S3S8D1_MYTED|nr:unnamed protein product [Mytilus edulis]
MVEDRSENVYNDLNSNQSESCVDKRNIIVEKQCNRHRNMDTDLKVDIALKSPSKSLNLCKKTLTVIAEIHAQAFDNASNQRISGNEVKTFNGELCQGIEIADETEMERESEYISIEELEKGQASPSKGSNFVSSQASPIKGNNSLTAQTSQIIENQMKENNFLFTQTSSINMIKESNSLSAQPSPMKGSNSLAADLETCQMKKSNSFSAQASPMKGSNSLSAQSSPMKGSNSLSAQSSPMKGSNSLSAQLSPLKGSNFLAVHALQKKKGSNFYQCRKVK